MSVTIRCGIKVNGIRKESHSQCRPPVYNKKKKLVKGCPLWQECIEELSKKTVEVFEDKALDWEIQAGLAFQDVLGEWKIFRKI